MKRFVSALFVLPGLFIGSASAEQFGLNLTLGVAGSMQEGTFSDFNGNNVDSTPIGKIQLSYGIRIAPNISINASWFHASSLQADDPGIDLIGADLVVRLY